MNYEEVLVEDMDVLMTEDSAAMDSADFEGAADLDTPVSSDEEKPVLDAVAPDYAADAEILITEQVETYGAEDTASEMPKIIIEEGEGGLVIHVPENVEVSVKKEEEKIEASPAPTATDNLITLGLVAALVLAIIAIVFRKIRADKKPAPVVVEEIPSAPAVEAPGSAGALKLYDTDPKTAAMLMAIVADKLQKPLNELRFISIKEVE